MRNDKPRRKAPKQRAKKKPDGRRNLSAVAESLGLPDGYIVTKYQKGEVCDLAWVERREARDRTCPTCGASGSINGHYRTRVWHTPTRGGAQLCLLLDQVRLRCPHCDRCWSDGHEDLLSDVSHHMTRAVAECIECDLMLRKSVKECTATWGPSRHLVNKVVEAAFVDWQYLPTTLCIDEFKADTDTGKMAVGIYDGDAGRIVEVLPDMRSETIDRFFDGFSAEQRSQVAFFCCDMSPEMVAVQRRWLPQAKLCIDRFHVIKLANKALSDVRKRVQADESIPLALRKELKGSWRLLVLGRDRLREIDDGCAMEMAEKRARARLALDISDDELDELERLLSLGDGLRVAYALCHSLRVPRRAGKEAWWDGMPAELAKWCSLAIASHIPEVEACARTIKRNREGILNSYRYGRTNAVAEGVNNSIKVTKRRGYGIRRFEAFRRRILLAMGLGRVEVLRPAIRDIGKEEGEATWVEATRKRLFEGSPDDINAGDVYDMVWCERRDGFVDVRVNVTLEDGETIVRRVPSRISVTRDWEGAMGLLTLEVELDVEVPTEDSPGALLELGRISEDEHWDMVE